MDFSIIQGLLDGWLSPALLIFARITGFITRAPVFSEGSVPLLARVSTIFLFTILAMSCIEISPIDFSGSNFFMAMIMNFIVGYLIGFLASMVVHIAQVAGEIVDIQSGINTSVVTDIGIQSTLFSYMLRFLGLLLLMYFGGLELCLYSLKMSFTLFPLHANDLSLLGLTVADIIGFTRDVIILGVTTASPILVVIILTDIVLGIMSRAAQQINPFQLSFALKPIIGVVILMFSLPLIQAKFLKVFEQGANIFRMADLEDNPHSELKELRLRLESEKQESNQ